MFFSHAKNYRTAPRKGDKDPSRQNVEDVECLQAEYDQLYDYITKVLLFVPVQLGMKKAKK